jgi:hypothetical protein
MTRHISGLVYVTGADQYLAQINRANAWGEKVRAAIIMQAWMDGLSTLEYQDEIIITEKPDARQDPI